MFSIADYWDKGQKKREILWEKQEGDNFSPVMKEKTGQMKRYKSKDHTYILYIMMYGIDEDETRYFCYQIIKNEGMCWIALPLCLVAIVLLFYAGLKYRLIHKIGASKEIKLTYLLILLWGLFFMSKMALSTITYLSQKDSLHHDDALSTLSEYMFSLDIGSVFIMQTALALIPYNWMVRIMEIFLELTNYESESKVELEEKDFKFERRSCIIFRVYLYIRLSYIIAIIVLLADNQEPVKTTIAQVLLICLVGQTFLLLIVLGMGYYALENNQKIQEFVEETEIQLMKNQYMMLVFCTLVRLANNGYFVVQNYKLLEENDTCGFDNPSFPSYVMFVTQPILTHFLPILIMLRIYRINKDQIGLSESLIEHQDQSS